MNLSGVLLKILVVLFSVGSVVVLSQLFIPGLIGRYSKVSEERGKRAHNTLEEMYIWVNDNKLILTFGLTPIVLGVALYVVFYNPLLIIGGFAFGFIFPMMLINMLDKERKKKFYTQLPDAVTTLSQSLKAGLSFLQAVEVVAAELPVPISQEFSLLVKENKMGVPLKESFRRLNKKMESEDLEMITTAIMISFETGSNLTEIFNHLNENIREKNRVMDQLVTLTTQVRLQAKVLSALPIVFGFIIIKINPDFFDQMLSAEIGRFLLFWCVISEVIGTAILFRMSRHIEV